MLELLTRDVEVQYHKPLPGQQVEGDHRLAQNLFSFWPFNEGSGARCKDVMGARDGTLSLAPAGGGMSWGPGRGGVGLSSAAGTGTVRGVTMAGIVTGTTFTWECWLFPRTLTDAFQALFAANGGNGIYLRNTGAIDYFSGNSGLSTGVVTTLKWWHLVVVNRGGPTVFYINGVRAGTNASRATFTADTMFNDTLSETFNGNVELTRFWLGRALTDAEVIELYASPWSMMRPFGPRIGSGSTLPISRHMLLPVEFGPVTRERGMFLPVEFDGLRTVIRDALLAMDFAQAMEAFKALPVEFQVSPVDVIRRALLPVETTGIDPDLLLHIWNVFVTLNAPFLHAWDVISTAELFSIMHQWDVLEPAEPLPHRWDDTGDILTPFGVDPATGEPIPSPAPGVVAPGDIQLPITVKDKTP